MRRIVVLGVVSCLLVPLSVLAQEAAGPMTWLAFSKLAHGKSGQDGVAVILKDKEMLDQMLADGVLAGHGIIVPANHRPGDTANFLEWVSVADWGKVGEWVGRVVAHQASMDEAEAAARQKEFEETFQPGSHYDEVVRNVVFYQATPEDFAKVRVFYTSSYTAKEGHGADFTKLAQDEAVPVANQLVAEGHAISYGMHEPEIHGVDGWTHRMWWALPGLEGVGKLKAAFAAVPGLMNNVDELTVPGTHFDTVWISFSVNMPPSGD